MLETRANFEHVLIDLKRKPAEFLELSPTGLVPLLQLDDGSVVTESTHVARRIASDFVEHVDLLPAYEASSIDAFIAHWTGSVEPAYYKVLSAESEDAVRFATVGLLDSLRAVEDRLWQGAMQAS